MANFVNRALVKVNKPAAVSGKAKRSAITKAQVIKRKGAKTAVAKAKKYPMTKAQLLKRKAVKPISDKAKRAKLTPAQIRKRKANRRWQQIAYKAPKPAASAVYKAPKTTTTRTRRPQVRAI